MSYINIEENSKSLREIGKFNQITGKILIIKAINWNFYTIFVVAQRTSHNVYIVRNGEIYKMPIEPLEIIGATETPIGVNLIEENQQIYGVFSSQISEKLGEIS